MGFRSVFLHIDWPSVFCFLVHILSSSSLPTLTKLLISHLSFAYPTTLALIHTATIAICLWFWTILNIFRPRYIPLRQLIPLSLSAAITAVVTAYCLSATSLLHYQIVHFLPLVILVPIVQALPFLIGAIIICISHTPSLFQFSVLFATLFVTFLDRVGPIARIRRSTRATDLQLQLFVRSLSVLFIAPVLPFVDDLSATSSLTSRLVGLDEPTSFFVYSTGMLAFFSFVSIRVSHSKLHPHVFRAASVFSAAPMLVIHFVVYDSPRVIDVACLMLMLAGVYHITIVNDLDMGSDTDSCSESTLSSLSDLDGIVVSPLEPSPGSIPVNHTPHRYDRVLSIPSSQESTETSASATMSRFLLIL